MVVEKRAYGKVNLFLSVGALRPDNRHDVENVMCRVGVYDTVRVEKTDSGITLDMGGSTLPVNEENLAYRAAMRYFEASGISGGAKISIEKRMPVKAGMAGGSTDAASVLLALNDIYGALSLDELVKIGAELGADVPFFLYDKSVMLGRGTGTALADFPPLPKSFFGVFVTCGEKQSTGAMFSLLDRTRSCEIAPKSSEALCMALKSGNVEKILSEMKNDFEICFEGFEEIAKILYSLGAKKVMLSGSGPTAFGVFEYENEAKEAMDKIEQQAFVCEIGI